MIRHLHSKNMTGDKRSRYEGNVATITIRHVLGSREAAVENKMAHARAHTGRQLREAPAARRSAREVQVPAEMRDGLCPHVHIACAAHHPASVWARSRAVVRLKEEVKKAAACVAMKPHALHEARREQ